jgi:hypothetical protein
MPEIKEHISLWDIIKSLDQVHIAFRTKYYAILDKYGWVPTDARGVVFYSICSLIENISLTITTIGFASHHGLKTRDWWYKYAAFDVNKAFKDDVQFETYVDDQCRQMVHRLQEQLATTSQIYIEAFIRNTARQLGIEHNVYWRLKERFFTKELGLYDDDLLPITIFQNLKNSLHNKGIHYNEQQSKLQFILNDFDYKFEHTQIVRLSWDHYRNLLIATSEVLYKIVTHPKVATLPSYEDRNIVVIDRGDDAPEL